MSEIPTTNSTTITITTTTEEAKNSSPSSTMIGLAWITIIIAYFVVKSLSFNF